MQPFEVQPDEGTINGPAAELRPTKLLCQFPVIFPGSHIVLISMLHKFCSRMQAAGWKQTLIEKPRPRPSALRRKLGGSEGNSRAVVSQICQHLEITGEIENTKIRLILQGEILQGCDFIFLFLLWSSKNEIQCQASSMLFLVVAKKTC